MASVTDERRARRLARGARPRARLLRRVLARARRRSRSASSTSAGSTRRCGPDKRGGAFCAYTVPTVAPVRAAQLHRARGATCSRSRTSSATACTRRSARARASSTWRTPLTLAETAIGVRRDARVRPAARRRPATPESRLALLAENIEGSIATVFRQVAMNRFEHLVHTARRERGRAVASSASASCGRESQAELLGDAVEITDGYRIVVVLRARTSSARRATSTPTPTGSCSRSRSTRRYEERGRRASCPPTSSCSPPAARAAPRSSGDRRRRPRRPGLLGPRARPRRAPARRGRGRRARGGPDLAAAEPDP